jgi:hypothetical protein
MWPQTAPYRSVKEIVSFLQKNPNSSESQIQQQVFGYYRNSSYESNKKYADMLRRGLAKGYYSRVADKSYNDGSTYRYFIVENNH